MLVYIATLIAFVSILILYLFKNLNEPKKPVDPIQAKAEENQKKIEEKIEEIQPIYVDNEFFKRLTKLPNLKKKHEYIVKFITEQVAQFAQKEPQSIKPTETFASIGLSSVSAVQMVTKLSEFLGTEINPTLLFNYPTIDKVAIFVETDILRVREKIDTVLKSFTKKNNDEPIAVVGIGCRFNGGATGVKELWSLLENGKDGMIEVPADRWNIDEFYSPDRYAKKKMITRKAGFISDVDKFDPEFFEIYPKEAKSMDPEQRILMEVSWETLENAGYVPSELIEKRVGVFVGKIESDYCNLEIRQFALNPEQDIDYAVLSTGVSGSVAAGRISYFYGFQGPAITMDTACSSSLVSSHIACSALRNGECDLALAGGVNLCLDPELFITFTKTGMLSADGKCKTFDDTADGYARGEGCGFVLLKRLSEAQKDGDNILALIRGSYVNQDGKSSGLTAPNGNAQQIVIKGALKAAGVSADAIDYVEAHGTGTSLGDPIEMESIQNVFRGETRNFENPLMVGSVKTNLGHTEGAAGVAGMLKIILALQNEKIPQHLNLTKINKKMPRLETIPCIIPYQGAMEWPKNSSRKRLAGVSSFGFSGTNAHVIFEESPQEKIQYEKKVESEKVEFFNLSAKALEALKKTADKYVEYINTNSADMNISDLCNSVNKTRTTSFDHRIAIPTRNLQQIVAKLSEFASSEDNAKISGLYYGKKTEKPTIVFFFTGQGSQYHNMGKVLFETNKVFRNNMEKCDAILKKIMNESIISLIFNENQKDTLDQTEISQPALFCIEYCVAQMWISLGVEPDVLLGHSVGEVVAACISGVFSLEEGLKLIATRARLMASCPANIGGMMAINDSMENVQKILTENHLKLSVAAENGANTAVSGLLSEIEKLKSIIPENKRTVLKVSHAFHSNMMEPILAEFEKEISSGIEFSKPNIPIVSNLHGEYIDGDSTLEMNAKYWTEHIRKPVLFMTGVKKMLEKEGKNIICIEVGPRQTLSNMTQNIIDEQKIDMTGRNVQFIGTLSTKTQEQFAEALSYVHCAGIDIDWKKYQLEHNTSACKTLYYMPTYQFLRGSYWFDKKKGKSSKFESEHPVLGIHFSGPNDTHFFQQSFSLKDVPFFRGHKIYGNIVLPATAYIEMMISAIPAVFDGKTNFTLNNLVLEEPIIFEDPNKDKLIQVVVKKQKNSCNFEVYTVIDENNDRSYKLHCSASAVEAVIEKKDPFDSNELKGLNENSDMETFYEQIGEAGYTYEKAFQNTHKICSSSGNKAITFCKLDAEEEENNDSYFVHPALLDSTLHAIIAAVVKDTTIKSDSVYLPVGVQSVIPYSRDHNTAFIVVCTSTEVSADVVSSDVHVYSEETKELLMSMMGFRTSKVKRETFAKMMNVEVETDKTQKNNLFSIDMIPKNLIVDQFIEEEKEINRLLPTLKSHNEKINMVVFGEENNAFTEGFLKLVKVTGIPVLTVYPASTFTFTGDKNIATINPTVSDEYRRLFELGFITSDSIIVHMWSFAIPQLKAPVDIAKILEFGCGSLMFIAQNLLLERKICQMVVVTNNYHQNIEQAPISGMTRALSIEFKDFRPIRIDIESSTHPYAVLVEILQEHGSNENLDFEDEIFYRGNKRFLPKLVNCSNELMEKQTERKLSAEKAVIISGGLGGLGMVLTKYFLEQGVKHIFLLSRRVTDAKNQELKEKFKEFSDAEVLAVAGDVADFESMKVVLENISAKCEIGTIVHAAGVLSDKLIMDQSIQKYTDVFTAKIAGTWNLHTLSLKYPSIENFVLFSSIASLYGSPGQTNYSAGNSFLDSMTYFRKQLNLPCTSINWGNWSEVGMSVAAEVGSSVDKSSYGVGWVSPKDGVEAFDLILKQSSRSQIGVVPMQWRKFFDVRESLIPAFYSEIKKASKWRRKAKGEIYQQLLKQMRKMSDKAKRHIFLVEFVQKQVAAVIGNVGAEDPLMSSGMKSLEAVQLRNALSDVVGTRLEATLFINYSTISQISSYLEENFFEKDLNVEEKVSENKQKKSGKSNLASDEPIAVVGLACRLPCADEKGLFNDNDEHSFWKMLFNGKSGISEIPVNRFDVDEYYDKEIGKEGKMYTKWASFVKNHQNFDAAFFGITPTEALTMDPQQRLLLECTWEGLENAGLVPKDYVGKKVGVFVGNMFLDYKEILREYGEATFAATGTHLSVLAGRTSFTFGFRGPCVTMDTACSSSLVSTHLACQALRAGECKMAVAAGVNMLLIPENFISECSMRMLSEDGKCHTFDEKANGYTRGEGCGVVVLKRLSDAIKDGNNILGLLRGSAVNQDGRSSSLTAPSESAQVKVVADALKMAKLTPNDIDLLEAHGTGTPLGDPIEVGALLKVFADRTKPLILSSGKTNIGHAEGTAGIAGIIKLLLSLRNEFIPRHLNFYKMNPAMPQLENVIIPSDKGMSWPRNPQRKRLAGVSSFGFSGTNAHMIVEEAPLKEQSLTNSAITQEPELFFLSAKTLQSLEKIAERYIEYIALNKDNLSLTNLCFSANTTRTTSFPNRMAIYANSLKELSQKLTQFVAKAEKEDLKEIYCGKETPKPKVAFLFTGQGSQYYNMGKKLYESDKVFRANVDKCDSILKSLIHESIISLMFDEKNKEKLDNTEFSQPALFCIEYCVAQMWMSLGVVPDVLLGHSVGEVVAACISGVFTLEEGLKLISVRGKLMASLPENIGGMMAVNDSMENVTKTLESKNIKLTVAAENGANTTVSGLLSEIEKLKACYPENKRTVLKVSNAFHSEFMEPILEEFEKQISEIKFEKPNISIVSNLHGEFVDSDTTIDMNAKYWTEHIRKPVLFLTGMKKLVEKHGNNLLCIEVGPRQTLSNMTQTVISQSGIEMKDKNVQFIGTLSTRGEYQHLAAVCQAFCSQVDVEMKSGYYPKHQTIQRQALFGIPTYQFHRKRFYASPAEEMIERTGLYTIKFQEDNPTTSQVPPEGTVLIYSDVKNMIGFGMSETLKSQKGNSVLIMAGDEYAEEENCFQINPSSMEDINKVLNHEKVKALPPISHAVHLWSLDIDETDLSEENVEKAMSLNVVSLMHMIKAIAQARLAPKLLLVTRNVHSINNKEPAINILNSFMWGFVKTLNLEHPEFQARIADIEDQNQKDDLIAEFTTHDEENLVAYRDTKRYVARLNEETGSSKKFQIDSNKVYLFSGGCSGLGFSFFKHFVMKKGLKKAVLMGRGGIRDENIQKDIAMLQSLFDVNVRIEKGDVTSLDDVKRIVRLIQKEMGPLGGVVHAAGVFDNVLIDNQDKERFLKLHRPKVNGTLNLHLACMEENVKLDHFVTFSSIASTIGAAGSSSYASSNAFLDSFSYYRNSQGLNAKTVNWGLFGDTGGAVTAEVFDKEKAVELLKYEGQGLLDVETGFQLFEKAMSLPISQVGAGVINWKTMVQYKFVGKKPKLFDNVQLVKRSRSAYGVSGIKSRSTDGSESSSEDEIKVPGLVTMIQEFDQTKFESEEKRREAETGKIEEYLANMVKTLTGYDEEAKGKMDYNKNFVDFGADSIMGVQMRNKLSEWTGRSLPANLAFTYPTISAAAGYIQLQAKQAVQEFQLKMENSKSASTTTVAKPSAGGKASNISFADRIQYQIKSFILQLVQRLLKDETISENQHLVQIEANLPLNNEIKENIEKQFGVSIQPEVLFSRPSVASLTNAVIKGAFMAIDQSLGPEYEYFKTHWVQLPKANPDAKLRLFMTAPAGFNPTFFRSLLPLFPKTIEVAFIHIPGRTQRLDEGLYDDMSKLAKACITDMRHILSPTIAQEKGVKWMPYAFLGHCMGGQINYELCCEILRQQLPMPVHKFVVCSHAPQFTNNEFPDYKDNDDEVLKFIANVAGGELPRALRNANTTKLLLKIMKADLKMVGQQHINIKQEEGKEHIVYHENLKEELAKLPVSVTGWYGTRDTFVLKEFMAGWSQLLTKNQSFSLTPMEGDHYPYVDVNGDLNPAEPIRAENFQTILKAIEQVANQL